ncbi:hypothetical protein [Clostridium akagii]|uniref:hypothetical protein n=1 Tax=Clostridium akagii TaxID=91623 RepID=UPI00047D8B40|nr:hypothetical protein [Clostridium akagii]
MFYRNENNSSNPDNEKHSDAIIQYTQPIGDNIDTMNSSMHNDSQSFYCPFMNRQRPYPVQRRPYPMPPRRRRRRRRRRPFPFLPFPFGYPYSPQHMSSDYYDDYDNYDDYDDYDDYDMY